MSYATPVVSHATAVVSYASGVPRSKPLVPSSPHSIRFPHDVWAEVEDEAARLGTTPSAVVLERVRGSFSDAVSTVLAAAGDEADRQHLRSLRPHPRLDAVTAATLRAAAAALNTLAARW